MIKVKASTPKEIEVTIKLDQRSAELVRQIFNGIHIGDIYESAVDNTEYGEDEVAGAVLEIINGLEGEL